MQAALALVIVCVDIVFDVIHSVSESQRISVPQLIVYTMHYHFKLVSKSQERHIKCEGSHKRDAAAKQNDLKSAGWRVIHLTLAYHRRSPVPW